jgi:hypothetical protein
MPTAKATRYSAVAALLAAVVLSGAPVASGSSLSWSADAYPRVAVVKARSLPVQAGRTLVSRRSSTRSCAADRRHTLGPLGWQLLPVACEQPPRSNLVFQLRWLSLAGLFG